METVKVICPYCRQPAELVDSKEIYGRSYGHKMWICRNDLAWVGCHKGSIKPLGRLANAELRHWKNLAHEAFDPLWKYGRFKGDRDAAYRWLSQQMGVPYKNTHIGMFDVAQCQKAIQIINERKVSL